ncbi:hypothetical protein B0A50_08752 [Salinomyces thailandicus]|uniref:Ribosomal protein S13 n=1 Tax=Salinomyces thailandicus TaxID=706561 RepID=A0A4U0TJ29_9PEZI|nr:hypothetical protein B0A50_08752 [Salinomyces thailandica]
MCTSEPEVRMESECDHFRVNDFNLSTANVHPFPLAAMVFIFGVNFPESQLVSRSLKSFYGIGPNVCTKLMAKFHIHNTARIGTLGDRQIDSLAAELSTMTLENDLRRQLQDNIKRLRDMGTYRGRRHAMSLPVRGQKTRSQNMTARKLNRVERRG